MKYLDLTGLQKLWTKIKNYVKPYIKDVSQDGNSLTFTKGNGETETLTIEGGGTPTKIEKDESYVEAFSNGVTIEGEVLDILGDSILIEDWQTTNSIYLDVQDGVKIKGSNINIGTEHKSAVNIGATDLTAFAGGDVHIEQSGSGSKLFFDSGGDAHLDADASLTLHKGDDESGIDLVMSNEGTTISNPNGVNIKSDAEIYLCSRAEESNAVTIEAENDGRVYITGGDVDLYSANLKLGIGGSIGTAGQVLMSDGQYAYWGDVEGSSGGGATLSMPRIRFANYRYDEPVIYYEESCEFTGKITFSVHIQDGTVQVGDQLQVCKMGKTYGKNKLQVFMQKTITAEDIENLAKQPYLQITTDDAAGNTHGADTNRVFNRLRHNERECVGARKPKYIRIRRPIYKNGKVVNAIFSNVEPVDMLLKFEIYAE